MNKAKYITALFLFFLIGCNSYTDKLVCQLEQPVLPILTYKEYNPLLKITLINKTDEAFTIKKVVLSTEGTTSLNDIESVSLFGSINIGTIDVSKPVCTRQIPSGPVILSADYRVEDDTVVFWVSVKLKDSIDLSHRVSVTCLDILTDAGKITVPQLSSPIGLRVGIALRVKNQDGIASTRIPGLATTLDGTLLAIWDGRKESDRDLQGDIDICLNRSTDGGTTWSPMKVILDMKEFGGLPEKYNGVSDACILVDKNNGDIYVAGTWMHGIIDPETGKWVEGLTDESTEWNHQWRANGSHPGYGLKESSQFLITKSSDDGLTWSEPVNITKQVKKKQWWLLSPAPGAGIALSDGTLVFPSEGRDENDKRFSTITWSQDGGNTWTTGNPAYYNSNECMLVELSDHSIMLNIRDRSNRGKIDGNGRGVRVSSDLGKSWKVHPTSNNALIESACQASIYRHCYKENNDEKSIILFLNPSSKTNRDSMTLKTSFDDGNTWPESNWQLLDEYEGNGYSCISSVNDSTIGVLYESSQADLVFQQISLREILK